MPRSLAHDSVISTLVEDLRPTEPVRLGRLLAGWTGFCVVVFALYLALVGPRDDLATLFTEPRFLISFALLMVMFAGAAALALRAGIPGRLPIAPVRWLAIVSVLHVLWILIYARVVGAGDAADKTVIDADALRALGCCLRISLGTAIPAAASLLLVSRLAPQSVEGLAVLALSSGFALVSMVSQLNCPHEDVFHIVVGHGLMLWVVGAGMFWALRAVGDKIIKKAQHERVSPAVAALLDERAAARR
jgi:hypothetical protein